MFPFNSYKSEYILALTLDYRVDLDYNNEEGGEERVEETRMVLPGTLTVEDVRYVGVGKYHLNICCIQIYQFGVHFTK